MATRSTDKLKCECGHEGTLRSTENDQPYSSHWVSHKLDGFDGSVDNWDLAKVRCPTCGETGKVSIASENSQS